MKSSALILAMSAVVTGYAEPNTCARQLIDRSFSVPPEFGADVLLRATADESLGYVRARKELLEEAFTLANSAHTDVPRKSLPGKAVDTRDGYAGLAAELKMDRLSLQSRIVHAMAAIAPRRARELFEQIRPPDTGATPCKSTLIADLGEYYKAALSVFAVGFDERERRKEEHMTLLLGVVAAAKTPQQLAPLAAALRSTAFSPDELMRVSGAISGTLSEARGDDRSFTATYTSLSFGVLRLMVRCHEAGVACAPTLAEAYGSYTLTHLKGTRCADNVSDTKAVSHNGIIEFNRLLRSLAITDVAPIVIEDVRPHKIQPEAEIVPFWTSPTARAVLAKIRALRFGGTKSEIPVNERMNNEWLQEFEALTQMIADWKASEEKTPADYLHQKALALKEVTALAPATERRRQALLAQVNFLTQSYSDKMRGEWLLHLHWVLRAVLGAESSDRGKALSLLQHSGNPILGLYVDLYSGCREGALNGR